MCGIAGFVGPEAAELTARMLEKIAHRGPDASGLWRSDEICLGHQRLAIVDLSEQANQPLLSHDRKTVMVANGEIYNAPELRSDLESAGAKFKSNSDNEVLLHAYRANGVAGLTSASGMFAAALWDDRAQQLILIRDRLGIKPLYYRKTANGFAFASEIKALLCISERESIDAATLAQYLQFGNYFEQRSLYEGISCVKPGEVVTLEHGHVSSRIYWQPDFSRRDPSFSFDSATQAYLSTASKSVRRHLLGDVPVAAYLSAGIDSSMVAVLADRDTEIATYTGSFSMPGWYDEASDAAITARTLRGEHTTVDISAAQFAEVFDEVIRALDEPRMGPGAFSQYVVAQSAAKRFKVILTGHGGDELFAGYPVFKAHEILSACRHSIPRAARGVASLTLSELPHLAYFAAARLRSAAHQHYLPVLFPRNRWGSVLTPAAHRRLNEVPASATLPLQGRLRDVGPPGDQLMWMYLRTYLPGLFVVEDKISMAHSLESRTPLCDDRMVELGLRIPPAIKLNNWQLKAIPKSAGREVLPQHLYKLPKRGFPTPLGSWLRGPLHDWAVDRLNSKSSPLRAMISARYLQGLTAGLARSPRNLPWAVDALNVYRAWMLLSLDSWLRGNATEFNLALELE